MSRQLIADANPGTASWALGPAAVIKYVGQHTVNGPVSGGEEPFTINIPGALESDFVFTSIRVQPVDDYTGYVTRAIVSAPNTVTLAIRGYIPSDNSAIFNIMLVAAI